MVWILLIGVAADVGGLVDARVDDGLDDAVGVLLHVGVPAAVVGLSRRILTGLSAAPVLINKRTR